MIFKNISLKIDLFWIPLKNTQFIEVFAFPLFSAADEQKVSMESQSLKVESTAIAIQPRSFANIRIVAENEFLPESELTIREVEVAPADFTIVKSKEIEAEKAIQSENVVIYERIEAENITVENAENIAIPSATAKQIELTHLVTEETVKAVPALEVVQICKEIGIAKTDSDSLTDFTISEVHLEEKTPEIGISIVFQWVSPNRLYILEYIWKFVHF